jgi:hypothetical protein
VLYFSTPNTVLQSIVPDEMRGRGTGIRALLFANVIALGRLEAGLAADFLGTQAHAYRSGGAMRGITSRWLRR